MPKTARTETQPLSIEDEITQEAIERLERGAEGRMREIMVSLTRHLHGFIREIEPTEEEWLAAIQFLTATGQKCDDQRQEFILLSDTLGASMLIDAINNRKPSGATESSVLGPFYREGAPDYESGADLAEGETDGERVLVSGKVTDLGGAPIAGAVLDIWQTAPNAEYAAQDSSGISFNLCGRLTTGDDGGYSFRTRKPVSYTVPGDGPVGAMLEAAGRHNWRPAHAAQDSSGISFNLCGRLTTGDDGGYSFRTRKPVSYTVPGDGPVGAMLEAAGRHNWPSISCCRRQGTRRW